MRVLVPSRTSTGQHAWCRLRTTLTKRNLLLVTGRFPQRSETFIFRKVFALAGRGHDVTMLTRHIGDMSLLPEKLPSNVRVEEMPPDDALRAPTNALTATAAIGRALLTKRDAARELLELCRRDPRTSCDPYRQFLRHVSLLDRTEEIAHFEFLGLAAQYPLAREVLKRPVVVSCRGNDVHTLELQPEPARRAGLRWLREADGLHCVSSEMASEVSRLSGRNDRIWVNRPAVATDTIAVRPEKRGGPFKILATGRLVWKKGFDYLLAALARVAARGIDFHAEILGEGTLRGPLRYSIDDLGLHGRVTLVGGVSSTEALARMQNNDLFVLSSHEEGISNAVLEAMATGLPIVTTTAGGMTEAVTDGVEGFVVAVRDIATMAERIETLATNDELRTRMGNAARARAVADFSLTRQALTFESIYSQVLGKS